MKGNKMNEVYSVNRVEKKYFISESQRYQLQKYFAKILQQDPNNGDNGYMVRSLYFDTLYDDDFHDKEDGLEDRQKLRLRTYNINDNNVKLELKQKFGNYQKKETISIDKDDAIALSIGNADALKKYDSQLCQRIRLMMMLKQYRPKCIVEYRRFAFIYPANDIRITFDSEIKGTISEANIFDPNLACTPLLLKERCIMEVKYNNFMISYIKDAITHSQATQTAASKFCMVRSLVL